MKFLVIELLFFFFSVILSKVVLINYHVSKGLMEEFHSCKKSKTGLSRRCSQKLMASLVLTKVSDSLITEQFCSLSHRNKLENTVKNVAEERERTSGYYPFVDSADLLDKVCKHLGKEIIQSQTFSKLVTSFNFLLWKKSTLEQEFQAKREIKKISQTDPELYAKLLFVFGT